MVSALYQGAFWFHQTLEEIPVAGAVYQTFNEYLGKPVWGLTITGVEFATPYCKEGYKFTASQITRYPYIAGCGLLLMAFIVAKAVYKHLNKQ